jgi:hypothetical protein
MGVEGVPKVDYCYVNLLYTEAGPAQDLLMCLHCVVYSLLCS